MVSFQTTPKCRQRRRRGNVFRQPIPDTRSRDVEAPTTDSGQPKRRHHQAAGAGRTERPPTRQIRMVCTYRTAMAVWRSWSDQRSYSMPGPVGTGMGDRIGVQLLVREIYLGLNNQPVQLSLAIPPCVGTMSTSHRAVMLCNWE